MTNTNTWDKNAWSWNAWHWNTWNWNTWDRNAWNWNTWNWNTWSWNTWDRNTWYFNIDEPKVRIFWKETDVKREDIIFPDFLYFNLTEWIYESDMTEEEKEADENKYYKTTWGYLKSYEYKEAFQNSYNSLSEEEKKEQTKQLKALPNFDKDIFFEISWIDIEKENEEVEELTLEQICKQLGKNIKIIK